MHCLKRDPERLGYTLLELSIVLVVIGLIVGAIFVGQSLVRASQLQSIISDESRYVKAVQMFKDKYKELPGDMPTATNYWGAQDGGTGNTEACHQASFTAATITTCNGNGDGALQPYTETDLSVTYAELNRFWQQLYNAQFIEGCCNNTASFDASPRSKVGNAGFGIRGDLCATSSSDFFCSAMTYRRHYFTFGTINTAWTPIQPALTASEALALDQKIDDGLPNSGKLLTPTNTATYGNQNCTTNTPPVYNTSYTKLACGLLFDSGF